MATDRNRYFRTLQTYLSNTSHESWNKLAFVSSLNVKCLENYTIPDTSPTTQSTAIHAEKWKADPVSELLYPSDGPQNLQPIQCKGDGNCFYRSLSVLLFGTEEYHTECRVRTSLELVLNHQRYLNEDILRQMSSCRIDNILDCLIQTSVATVTNDNLNSYKLEVMRTIETGTYCSILHVYAASNAFGYKIQLIFPTVSNVAVNRNFMNQLITPLCLRCNEPLSIMWTHTTDTNTMGWTPNHFVPCIAHEKVEERTCAKRRCDDDADTPGPSDKKEKTDKQYSSDESCADELTAESEGQWTNSEKKQHQKTSIETEFDEDNDPNMKCDLSNSSDTEENHRKISEGKGDKPKNKVQSEQSPEEIRDTGTYHDVGHLIDGTVKRETLTDYEKYRFLTNHFNPGPGYKHFVTQIVTRGKLKEKKKLVFQASWLEKYGWLVYSPAVQGGLCKYCVIFSNEVDKRKFNGPFVTYQFTNLVKATGKDGFLEKHSNVQYHKDAVQIGLGLKRAIESPADSVDIKLNKQKQELYEKNLHILKSIVNAILLCGKQNLSLRGHRDDKKYTHTNKGTFLAILDLMAMNDPILNEHLEKGKRNAKYTSKTVQNEIIDIISNFMKKKLTASLQEEGSFFSIIADEVTDKYSNREVLALCLRLFDGKEIKEFLYDFMYVERTNGETIANAIIQSLNKGNVDIAKARGQAYDGAASMSSERCGVQARIKMLSPKVLYVHCNSHVLNLSIAHACKIPAIRNAFDVLNSTYLFFDNSPKRQRFLERNLQVHIPETNRKRLIGLCKTRWIERHTSLETFCELYESVCNCLEAILDSKLHKEVYGEGDWPTQWDKDTRIKAQGLLTSLRNFPNIIAFIVSRNELHTVKAMAAKLQQRDFDIYQAYSLIDKTNEKIQSLRENINTEFSVWFSEARVLAQKVGSVIEKPRISKIAQHRANAPSESVEEHFLRNLTIPFLDHILHDFEERFDSKNRKGNAILGLLPGVIIDVGDINDTLQSLSFWESDLPSPCSLRNEIREWRVLWQGNKEIKEKTDISLKECLVYADKDEFPNIRTLLKIGCTLPVTSCEAERSFSCLRRIKTFLRNKMTDDRLTGLALLNMHHNMHIDVNEICKDFIASHKRRMFLPSLIFE